LIEVEVEFWASTEVLKAHSSSSVSVRIFFICFFLFVRRAEARG
jgi:hypothetical protein